MQVTDNEAIAISAYPEKQHYFLIRTIRHIQQENTRLVQLGKAQKKHYDSRVETLKQENRTLRDRIEVMEGQVFETLKFY